MITELWKNTDFPEYTVHFHDLQDWSSEILLRPAEHKFFTMVEAARYESFVLRVYYYADLYSNDRESFDAQIEWDGFKTESTGPTGSMLKYKNTTVGLSHEMSRFDYAHWVGTFQRLAAAKCGININNIKW